MLTTAPTAVAAPATTYHGVWDDVVYIKCIGSPPVTGAPASGTWNVSIRPDGLATATFNFFVNGEHHLAYGMANVPVKVDGSTWTIDLDTLAGRLHVYWTGSALAYVIFDYRYEGRVCNAVAYDGH
jgi:hypothetical protein